MTIRYDSYDLDRAVVTPEGWIKDAPVLTRTGIFTYTRADGSTVREYRPPEEVFNQDSMRGLAGIPITVEHPRQNVKHDSPVSIVGTVISEGRRDGENLRADLIIHRPQLLGGRKELSLGYTVEIDPTPGEVNGERYDAVQRKIRLNHLAAVKSGRAGNARLRLDSSGNEVIAYEQERNDTMSDVTVRFDNIDYKVPPQVANEITKLQAARDSEKARADKAEGERDSFKSEADKLKTDMEQVRKDAAEAVRARMGLEAAAKGHGVEVKADMSDRQIREAVVRKVRGDSFDFNGKSDEYVNAVYDLAAQEKARADSNASMQRTQVSISTPGSQGRKSLGAAAARESMIYGSRR